MRVDFPGLTEEPLPSGAVRRRVRMAGNPKKRITIPVGPDHKDFAEYYHAARAGIKLEPKTEPEDLAIRGSLGWLTRKYESYSENMVDAGLLSPLTLKKRRTYLKRLRADYNDMKLAMPTSKVKQMRDAMASTPAAADDLVDTIRLMYAWGIEENLCDNNPAIGVAKIDPNKGGAIPWTVNDLKKFRDHHGPGTMPHKALTLFTFTACRIGDARILGPEHESVEDGIRWLGWQPSKKGSAFVKIPMTPQLISVVNGCNSRTYLVNYKGDRFSSNDSLGQMFRRWCTDAGLPNRSAHGIRKAAGNLLAEAGCTQYEIMAIHGHTQAKTSEIYTKAVERTRLAAKAMGKLEGLEW